MSASTYRRYPRKRRPTSKVKPVTVPAITPHRLWWIESEPDNAPATQPEPADEVAHHP
jgi:hypothetical protein